MYIYIYLKSFSKALRDDIKPMANLFIEFQIGDDDCAKFLSSNRRPLIVSFSFLKKNLFKKKNYISYIEKVENHVVVMV